VERVKIFIDYAFMDWNRYIDCERANKYHANNIKQTEKQVVFYTVREKYTGNYPVTLTVRPHFQNKRKDLDNYRLKGLIDGLVAAGVIKNDNLTCIDRIIIEPIFDKRIGVEIEIEETRQNDS
jgi:Holliday junction resolvase RusA-like endonuclease